jgi:hypothetical protein
MQMHYSKLIAVNAWLDEYSIAEADCIESRQRITRQRRQHMNKYTYIRASLLLMLLFVVSPARAQMLYTDISPDTTLAAPDGVVFHNYFVDLNQDAKDDFKFTHFVPNASMKAVEVYSFADEPEEEILVNSGRAPLALEAFFEISAGSAGTWVNTFSGSSNSALFMNANYMPGSPWAGVVDGYLGVRIKVAGAWHYGWIRLDVPADASSFTLKDFAVNLYPGESILAGESLTTPVNPVTSPDLGVDIYSVGKTCIVEFNYPAVDNATAHIYTLLGKHVLSSPLSGKSNRIRMDAVPEGTYMVLVRDGENVWTRLVVMK